MTARFARRIAYIGIGDNVGLDSIAADRRQCRIRLARFLAEVRVRARVTIPPDIDPIGLIMTRVGFNPHTPGSKALRKATLAVIATEDDMTEADLWALGQDALGLLDALAQDRLSGRYRQQDLATVEKRLRGQAS